MLGDMHWTDWYISRRPKMADGMNELKLVTHDMVLIGCTCVVAFISDSFFLIENPRCQPVYDVVVHRFEITVVCVRPHVAENDVALAQPHI